MSAAAARGWRLRWKRGEPAGLVDGSVIQPAVLSRLGGAELRGIKTTAGPRDALLGDLFEIEELEPGDGVARVVVDGSPLLICVGGGMETGSLVVEGDGGDRVGLGLSGGTLVVRGHAGRFAGEGQRGGEILVAGDAGPEVGVGMRRGLIAVSGSAGELPGHGMLAGTILVARGDLLLPGIEMRRGTIMGMESRARPPLGFAMAGPVSLGWLRILRSRLESLSFPLQAAALKLLSGARPMTLWSGDSLSSGRGELLQP